jgi:elongation factor P hydroxylase
VTDWLEQLNNEVLLAYHTRLVGGFPEPFYKAAAGGSLSELQFTRDYERSALHELAHWCIAGVARRCLDDYDYWYEPDGRTDRQQARFFTVEVKPQALEKHFCHALHIHFDVSVDNLGSTAVDGIEEFKARVERQYALYAATGLPERAAQIYDCLQSWKQSHRLKKL